MAEKEVKIVEILISLFFLHRITIVDKQNKMFNTIDKIFTFSEK